MSGSDSDEENTPAYETKETDSEAQELHDPQSPSPPESAVPFYKGLVYELLLEEPDHQEAGRVEKGQEANPLEDEREELPAPDDPQSPEAPPDPEGPQNSEAPPNPEGPQNPEDPSSPEGPKSTEDVEYELPVMEEAEEQDPEAPPDP